MNVLHFILGKADKARANGVNQVVHGLAKYCSSYGASVRIIGKAETVKKEGDYIHYDGFSVCAFSKWDQNLKNALVENIIWADVVHLHGVYSPLNILVGRMCQEYGTPYIVTLHNGLSSQFESGFKALKKWLFNAAFQKKHLESASALHVLTEEESTEVDARLNAEKYIMAPNGIDLDDYPFMYRKRENDNGPIVLGYLGRVAPEKNLFALCSAFEKLNANGMYRLIIAGPESEYGISLRKRFSKSGIELVGAVYGEEKAKFINSVDIFVIPSLSEGFPVSMAECLAIGTPLLVTRTSKVSYFYDFGCFFMCEPTEYGLKRGLFRVIAAKEEWPKRVAEGRRWVESELNWASISKVVLAEYKNIVEG